MGLTQSGEIRIGARLRQQRLTRGLTMSEVAEQAGLTAGFISQLERDLTSVSLSSLYRICAVLGIRAGDLIDDVPEGRLIRRDEQARRSLAVGDTEHLLLSSGDERRFHVTESRIPPGVSAGEELYTLPADVELAYVAPGLARDASRRGDAPDRGGRHLHLLAARPAHVAQPLGDSRTPWSSGSRTEPVRG